MSMKRIKMLLIGGIAGLMLISSGLGVSAAGMRDIFSAKYYAETYRDLKEAFGDDEDALYQHFLTSGIKEGRVMNPVLDVVKYRGTYGDLDKAFGDDWDAYVEHYLSAGVREKRAGGGTFDPDVYADAYPDVKAACGDDIGAVIRHYLTNGVKEGRTAGVTSKAASQPEKPAASASTPAPGSGAMESGVYRAMIALKAQYPEGMPWTNGNYYGWHGGIYSGGYGCAGFAFILSDAAFGTAPARKHQDFSNVRVGDIVRMNGDTHSVIILEVRDGSVVVAEGNYNSSVHWGREISKDELAKSNYVMTRY